jgi:hypothetical protein
MLSGCFSLLYKYRISSRCRFSSPAILIAVSERRG